MANWPAGYIPEEDEESEESEGPPNDDWINRAYQAQAGPNPRGKDRPVNPYDVKTEATRASIFNDRRNRG